MKINTTFSKNKDNFELLKTHPSLRKQKIKQETLRMQFNEILLLSLLLLNVILASATSPIQSINCSFKTFTNGGWGTHCHGTNAGCYLETHFATAFPNGLIIGCDGKLQLTSAAAVTEFLPSSGTVNTLPIGTIINPGQTYANTFAGQLVALMLNVRFDAYDPTFAPASGSLGSLVIAQGLFSGWTVNRFLDSANHVIGGCLTQHALSDWVQTATLINQNFDNGTVDMGFLRCVQPLQLSLEIQATIKCHGDSTGIIQSNVSGGVEPYLYQWSNNRNSQNVSGLPAGPYFVTVSDAAGQMISMDTVLNQPPILAVNILSTNVTCYGGNNGTMSLHIFGGTSPYSIEWSNGNTSSYLNNLFAGTYAATIVDSNGCQAKDSVIITQPELLTVGVSSTNVSCYGENNGTVSLHIFGGTSPYSFEWSNGNTSSYLNNLFAGKYVATIVDSNGCQSKDSVIITQPELLTVGISSTNVSCYGGNNGTASLYISGGTFPYSILWSSGSTSTHLSALTAGTYVVTLLDSNGCQVKDSVIISQPELLTVGVSSTNVSCHGGNNGTASLHIFGGTSPYSIEWSNGDTRSQLNNLFAGTYVVTIVDSNGCQAKDSVIITQPELLTVGISSTNVSCFGGNNGTVSLHIFGGTSPFSIEWSNGDTRSYLNNLFAGTDVVTIVDSKGCQSKDSVKITQPELLTLVISSSNVSCYGASDGNASLEITGGTAPYSILWNNGSDSSVLNNLSIGKYSVTVSDSHGCQSKDSLEIVEPKPLEMIINKSDVACYGGTGEVKPVLNGGTSPYSFELGGNLYQMGNMGSEPIGNWEVHAFDANGCIVNGLVSLSLLSCEGFTTVTQGGWHAKCSGENWGCTLDRYFSTFFPFGLTIGSNNRFLKLTSATAIHNFLPSSGTSRSLNVGTLTNPSSTAYKNTLAGQTVVLTLNCIFDANVSSFATSGTLLKDLIIKSGMFEGWRVEQLLMEANKALGGMSNYTYAELTSIIDKINSNYDNGLVNNGLLACPCSKQNTLLKSVLNESDINQGGQETKLSIFPNPITSHATIKIDITTATHATVDLLSVSGQHIQCLVDSDFGNESTHTLEIQTDKLKEGMYVVRLQTENSVETKRIIVLK